MLYLRLCAFDVNTWTTNKIKKVAVKIEKSNKISQINNYYLMISMIH